MTPPAVLIVDDEPLITEMFEVWLADDYDVTVANTGEDALTALDDAIDVVLLDRMMPGLNGDEALAAIRDGGYDCQVAMVTAVEPDYDVIAMGFDDYITKPVTEQDLTDVVESLLSRASYDDAVREYFALASKQAALESVKTVEELQNSQGYQQLTTAVAAARDTVENTLRDPADFEAAFRDL